MNPQVRLTSECGGRRRAEVGGDDGCVSKRAPPRVKKSDIYTATTAQSSPAGDENMQQPPAEQAEARRMDSLDDSAERRVYSGSDLIL